MADPELGIIEGYFGQPWDWATRHGVTELLAAQGYRFFHYAPKGDPNVRDDWSSRWPDEQRQALERFREHCRGLGVRFGVGICPTGLQSGMDPDALTAFDKRLAEMTSLGVDDLVLLFDDLAGDAPGLAERQIALAHRAAEAAPDARLFICPTYYSEDGLLDQLFGQRPSDYLEQLGAGLDRSIRVYWAGDEICPAEITLGELRPITEQLRRRPVLWDNYPVNDGAVMRHHLHLRAFTGRSSSLANAVAGHAINPALQGWLSCIPALTLPAAYREHAGYRYARAQRRAAEAVLGPELGALLIADLPRLVDRGRDRLSAMERAELTQRYQAYDHPGAREILHWLREEPSTAAAPTAS